MRKEDCCRSPSGGGVVLHEAGANRKTKAAYETTCKTLPFCCIPSGLGDLI